MTVFVVAEFRAAPGREDRLRTALEAMIEPALSEPGCLAYQPFVDPNDPAHLVAIGQWTGTAAWDAHLDSAHGRYLAGVLTGILAEPAVVHRATAGPGQASDSP
ncbi:putative quinol monooxygenase [Nocardia sp. alder85J]|uniref:putative quinol monooxygenase n=1 Tax=Nocardia sp. alder85J TaxID=2862949 RepID=UPI001CD5FDFA|nr:putative quinol monooxygenase [Nocardia sp. alder85J]MCX4097010.1 putative quinol monooxygenase [Nocardia sp. alder85J]